MSAARLGCLGLALLAACGGGPSAAGQIGASLARLGDGRLAIVDPDADSVSFVDEETLQALARVDVGDEPRALLTGPGTRMWVAVRRTGELVELGTDAPPRVTRRQAVCMGPRALAATPDGRIVVACEADGSVRRVDPFTLAVETIADGLDRPVAVAAAGDAVFALDAGTARLHRVGPAPVDVGLVPEADDERPALARMLAHTPAALALSGDSIAVAFELVNPSGEGNGEAVVDDYGSVTDSAPKINPALRRFSREDLAPADARSTYARYDAGPERRCNGPSALAALDAGRLLVAHRGSGDLAVIDPGAARADDRLVRTLRAGVGAAGIAVDEARGIAWVDLALDGTIARVALDDGGAAPTTRLRELPPAASSLALAGRRAFNDATNAHVSPAGVVTCATCHPEGGSDGVVWFIRAPTIPGKRRLSPHLANATAATAPFHWDGAFADRATLVRGTITDLMAGDALLVDGDAIAAYLDELVRPPVPPPGDAAARARGEVAFQSAGCATCHPAPSFTDRQKHAVLADPGSGPAALADVDTPGLFGLGRRRAFFHDGRTGSLDDVITLHGNGAALDDAARADLVQYLSGL